MPLKYKIGTSYVIRKGVFIIPQANLSLQIIPIAPEDQVYGIVDKVIALIKDSGLNYIVGPLETSIEGDLTAMLDLVKKSQEVCIDANATRVVSIIKIDYKPDGVSMNEKISKYTS